MGLISTSSLPTRWTSKKVKKWTGEDVRALRVEAKLTRREFADLLKVSPSAVEKWEHRSALKKEIKLKYWDVLAQIASDASVKIKVSLGAAALISPLAVGGALSLASLIETKNLDKTILLLNELKELSEEEREKFINILTKLN